MSSQAPDHKLELENQFILRLPQIQANALRQAIKSGEPLGKRLSIKFDSDIRRGNVRFDNWSLPSRLFDLPTIIESYKTLDRKNFYKTADICQILICKDDPEVNSQQTEADDDDPDTKERHDNLFAAIGGAGKREFLYPHGITPPLKNVRKRRFRKTLKKKYVDFSEIEKEVKRLFKFDCEAIESRYEIVEESKTDKSQPSAFSADNSQFPMSMGLQSAENSQNIDVHELFGEESSSDESDDSDDDDDKDDLEMDQEADSHMMMNDNDDVDNMDDDNDMDEVPPEPNLPGPDIADEIAAASDLISQNDDTEEKRRELNRELAKIRDRIEIQESEIRGLDNQVLRMRLQPLLDSLHEQESEIKRQLDELNCFM